jgi:VWFA-related protein
MRQLAILWLAAPLAAFWLQDAAIPTIRVTSRLVPIDVLVKDKSTGLRVDDLSADRFRVLDEGRPQVVSQFSRGSQARPLAVAIVVEADFTIARTLPILGSALLPAFGQLRPEDELMVVRMLPGAEIIQDLTTDRKATAGALERVADEQRKKKTYAHIDQSAEALHEALLLAARHLQERRPDARAAIVFIGSDFNVTPVPVLDQTTAQLIAAGASVHGLIRVDSRMVSTFKGIFGMLGKDKYRDQNVVWYSEQTGGEAIKMMKDADFGAAFEQVIGDIAATYTVAFVPNSDTFDDSFHKLTVEVQGPGAENLTVRARSRYYASLDQPIAPDASVNGGSDSAGSLPGLSSEPGIYYQTGGAYTQLREPGAPRMKITGNHGPAIVKAMRLALIQIYPGAKAALQISNPRPEFLVRRRREPSFARLARIQPVKDERWLKAGLFLDRERAAPALVISKIGGDLYRLTPAAPLPAGEYLLSLNETAAPVYDFGIATGPAR